MPISVRCPGCETKLKGRDEHAGRRVKCPCCGRVMLFPGSPAVPVAKPAAPAPADAAAVSSAVPSPTRVPASQPKRVRWPVYVGGCIAALGLCLVVGVVAGAIVMLRKGPSTVGDDLALGQAPGSEATRSPTPDPGRHASGPPLDGKPESVNPEAGAGSEPKAGEATGVERAAPGAQTKSDKSGPEKGTNDERGTADRQDADAPPDGSLRLQYHGMKEAKVFPVKSSFAFWDGDTILYLVFRNFETKETKWNVKPDTGRATLYVIVRKHDGGSFQKVTPGTYRPGLLPESMLLPIGAIVFDDKDGNRLGVCGAYWHVNTGKENGHAYWGTKQVKDLADIGTVKLDSLPQDVGKEVVGRLSLSHGKGEEARMAVGRFRIPVVKTPADR